MSFLIAIGISAVIYGVISLIFQRDSYDLARKNWLFLFYPAVVGMTNVFEGETTIMATITTIAFMYGLLAIIMVIYYKINGYGFTVIASEKQIIRAIGNMSDYCEEKSMRTDKKKVYINSKSEKIRLKIGRNDLNRVTLCGDFKSIKRRHENTVAKLIKIDKRQTGVREGVTILVIGIGMILAGIIF